MSTTKKGLRSGRRKWRRPGRSTGLWATVATVLTVALLIVQGTLMLVLVIVSWSLTALVGFIEMRSATAEAYRAAEESKKPAQTATGASSRGSGGRGARGGGSDRGKEGPGKPCDSRCRKSPKPKSTCKCSCKGANHGSEVLGGGAEPAKPKPRSRAKAGAKTTP